MWLQQQQLTQHGAVLAMSFMYMLNRTRDTTPSSATPVCMLRMSRYGCPATALYCLFWEPKLLVMQQLILSNFAYDPSEYNLLQTNFLVNITMTMWGPSTFSVCRSCEHVPMLVGDTPDEQHYTLS
jgi:hypothetical protein